jgi:hypothetical protein
MTYEERIQQELENGIDVCNLSTVSRHNSIVGMRNRRVWVVDYNDTVVRGYDLGECLKRAGLK